MNKTDILTEFYSNKEVQKAISNLIGDNYKHKEDFKQDLFIILLSKPDELIIDLYKQNKLLFYIVRITLNQLKSNTSNFHKTYVKPNQEAIKIANNKHELKNIDIKSKRFDFDIVDYLKKHPVLTWYEKRILEIYYKLEKETNTNEKVSLRTIEKEYGIDHVSLYYTIEKARKKIKKSLKQNGIH